MTDIEICEKFIEQGDCGGITCRECPLNNNNNDNKFDCNLGVPDNTVSAAKAYLKAHKGEPMKTTIELTQEQMEALNRGESITIQPKPGPWESKGGEWCVDGDNDVLGPVRSDENGRKSGRERATQELAERAAKASRQRDRLEAFRDEGWPTWKDNGGTIYSVAIDGFGRARSRAYVTESRTIGTVYGPKDFAEKAAEMINRGELVL